MWFSRPTYQHCTPCVGTSRHSTAPLHSCLGEPTSFCGCHTQWKLLHSVRPTCRGHYHLNIARQYSLVFTCFSTTMNDRCNLHHVGLQCGTLRWSEMCIMLQLPEICRGLEAAEPDVLQEAHKKDLGYWYKHRHDMALGAIKAVKAC